MPGVSSPTFRPLIAVVRPSADESSVEVTLDQEGWIADASAPVEGGDLMTAACRATCAAVNSMMPRFVHIEFIAAEHVTSQAFGRELVIASVNVMDDGRLVDELLGAAYVRTDLQVAAARATLDGLTRRLAGYL